MPSILISHSHDPQSLEFSANLGGKLMQLGHDVILRDPDIFRQPPSDFDTGNLALMEYDVLLYVVTVDDMDTGGFYDELKTYIDYLGKEFKDSKIIRYLTLGPTYTNHVFKFDKSPDSVIPVKASTDNDREFSETEPDEIAKKIHLQIILKLRSDHESSIERKEQLQKIEITSAKFIEDALEKLEKREQQLEKRANTWNLLGWGALILGVLASTILVGLTAFFTNGVIENWPQVFYYAIKSLIIITLLIASSKYAFTLASSYMTESLKNSDRIHAISFGKFFLQAFGENLDTSEVKEIFQHWNISSESSFSKLKTAEFDPKIVEAILSVADVVKTKDKKGKKP